MRIEYYVPILKGTNFEKSFQCGARESRGPLLEGLEKGDDFNHFNTFQQKLGFH